MKTKLNNNARGFVKMWRCAEPVLMADNNALRIYVYLLFRANIERGHVEGVCIERGQLATSIAKISQNTGISPQTARTTLRKLEDVGLIRRNQARSGLFSVVTCCEFDSNNDSNNDSNTRETAQLTNPERKLNNCISNDCQTNNGATNKPETAQLTNPLTINPTTNKEIKENQETCICINTDFKNLQNWIRENASTIKEIPQQLTPAQFDTLTGDGYTFEQIRDVIAEIANYNGGRYRSVYLTARNWLKRNRDRATESGTPATRSATRSRSTGATPSHGLHRNPNRGDFDATHNTGGILRKPANRGK